MLMVPHRCRYGAIALGLLVALLTLPAVAEPAAARDPDAILAALDSEDPRQREEQTRQLLADTALSHERLADLLARAHTAEQRHRLLAVARHHVLRQRREHVFDQPDRGSLGISHRTVAADDLPGTSGRGSAIEIVLTLPGFPAHAQLQAGDRVIAIEGDRLPADFSAEHFREAIINYRSGDKLEVTIDRHGEQLTRTIELASAQALGAMYDPGRLQLRPQFESDWAQARQRFQLDEPEPLRLLTPDPDAS